MKCTGTFSNPSRPQPLHAKLAKNNAAVLDSSTDNLCSNKSPHTKMQSHFSLWSFIRPKNVFNDLNKLSFEKNKS